MSLFSKSKIKNGVVVIIDIGTASIGGGLVLLDEGKKPKMLYNIRKPITIQRKVNEKKLIEAMTRSLNQVLEDLDKEGLKHLNFLKLKNKEIKEIFVFLASPWYVSQTRVIKTKNKNDFVVSKKLLEEIVLEEKEKFIQYELEQNAEIYGDRESVEIIDNKIIQTKLNGYKIDNPEKYKTKDLEMSIFVAISPKYVVDQIKNLISEKFLSKKIHTHSFSLASFLSIRDLFKNEEDFLFLDMGGEVTDVSFVKNGVLQEVYSFPIGRNFFIKEIMKILNSTHDIAISTLKMFGEEKLETPDIFKLEKVIKKANKKWSKELEKAMLKLSHGGLSPRNIYLMADNEMVNILNKAIKEAEFTDLVFPDYNEASNVISLDSSKMKEFCGCSGDIDIFLEIETVFINRLFELSP